MWTLVHVVATHAWHSTLQYMPTPALIKHSSRLAACYLLVCDHLHRTKFEFVRTGKAVQCSAACKNRKVIILSQPCIPVQIMSLPASRLSGSGSLGLRTECVRPDPGCLLPQYAWSTQSSLKRKSENVHHRDSRMPQFLGSQAWYDDVRSPSSGCFQSPSNAHAQRASRLLRAPARACQSTSPPRSLSYLEYESSRDTSAPIVQSVSRIPRVHRDGQGRCTPVLESKYHAEASRNTAREVRSHTTYTLTPVRSHG